MGWIVEEDEGNMVDGGPQCDGGGEQRVSPCQQCQAALRLESTLWRQCFLLPERSHGGAGDAESQWPGPLVDGGAQAASGGDLSTHYSRALTADPDPRIHRTVPYPYRTVVVGNLKVR